MSVQLGRLERVMLRSAWPGEATHFTPWLAQTENLALLAEAMGLEADSLELQGQEQAVGPFRADILCRNTEDDSLVLIENQLERTDHSHLGQLITYAAGLKAVTLVWIAERFTEEHRAALNWLNEITHESFHIFGLEIELWRIGNSPLAPKFNVVVQANEWTRQIQLASRSAAMTPLGQIQLGFWTEFGEYLATIGAPLKPPKPAAANWMTWGLGRSGVHLLATVNAGQITVGVEINTREHPTWFAKLQAHDAKVLEATGIELDWDEKTGKKHSIARCVYALDMRDEENWPEASQWIGQRLLKLRKVFRPLVKDLDDEPLEQDLEAVDLEEV